MTIKFNVDGVLALRVEQEEAKYLWENIHKSEVTDKEYDVLFIDEEVIYNEQGYFDYKYFDREMVSELLFLIRRKNELFLINNAVDSKIMVKAEPFNIDELNNLIGEEDFEIIIPAEATNYTGHYQNMEATSYFKIELNKDGIKMNIDLNFWKYKERKNSIKIDTVKKLENYQ